MVIGTSKSNLNANGFLGELLSSFIDTENGSCNFECDTFYKLLEYISALPDSYKYEQKGNYYEDYQTGRIALFHHTLYSPYDLLIPEAAFGTEDYAFIGYPVSDENGKSANLAYSSYYLITSYCEDTDEAWNFVRYMITPDYTEDGLYSFPVFKSSYDELCEKDYRYGFGIYYSGMVEWNLKEDMPSEPSEPGIISYFTEEDAAWLKEYLNGSVGVRESVPEEIIEIITEEISSFLSGVKTREECAKIIQSRVSLYLSERE